MSRRSRPSSRASRSSSARPGRLIDLYKQKHLVLKNVKMVILDEADEMLDLGFLPTSRP